MSGKSIYPAGYTLIELVIVVTIVGILGSMAVVQYRSHVVDACRDDAKIGLENVANAQEQFYFDQNRYAGSIVSVSAAALSPEGHYTLTTGLNDNSNTFVATAVQAAGQSCLPSNDIRYRINHTGLREHSVNGGVNWVSGWD